MAHLSEEQLDALVTLVEERLAYASRDNVQNVEDYQDLQDLRYALLTLQSHNIEGETTPPRRPGRRHVAPYLQVLDGGKA